MRNIGRLVLQKRRFSPAAEPSDRITATKRVLLDKVKADQWTNQDKSLKSFVSVNLINYLRTRKNYHSALQLYDWMETNKFEITDGGAAVRIDLLCKSEGLASAEKYFDSLPDSEKTKKTYGALLNCYRRERVLDKALEIFEKMKVLNYASRLSYNNLLSLYLSIEQPEKLISVFQEMKENQIPRDGYTYNLLINSYAALKNFDAIEDVLDEMRSNNVNCDSFTYGNLATIYFNAGLRDKAIICLGILEKMQNLRGGEVFASCQTRIKLYSEMNDLSGVKRAWDCLNSRFQKPNNTAYLFTLLALSKLGKIDSLEKLFKEWDANCSCYDIRLPNVMLEFYISRNMIEKAMALYESLLTIGGSVRNLRTLNSFITLCMKMGRIDQALKYLEMGVYRAGAQNSDWFPPDNTITLFLNYFKEKKDVDRTAKFIQSMKKVERLDSMVYDSLLLNVVR